jgi:hypothetical protein
MQKSLASSPLLPLGMGVAAVLLIAATFTNGHIAGADNPSLAGDSSSLGAATDLNAGAPAAVPAPAPAAPAAAAAADTSASSATLTKGKSAKIGGATVELVKETPKNAEVKIGKNTATIADGKSGKVGKYTVTVEKIDKKGDVTVSVK